MDWTEGYASDIEYTAGFYREQAPAYLNFTCLLNGVDEIGYVLNMDAQISAFEAERF